jgi:hypothetical protein
LTPIQVKFRAKQVKQASQLRRWGVLGKPYADLAIEALTDTHEVEIGQVLNIRRYVYNTSDTPFSDSTFLHWQIIQNGEILESQQEPLPSLWRMIQ